MIAVDATFQGDPSSWATFPLLKSLDELTALALWVGAALCFTWLIKYALFRSNDKLRASGACYWWSNESILERCCPKRKARYFKCIKRCERRKAKCSPGEGKTNWSCPFDCKFARIHMPAPLPFRRKKRSSPAKTKPAASRAEAQPPLESNVERSEVLEANVYLRQEAEVPDLSISSDESLTLSEGERSATPTLSKSKRRHRRKRRSSSGSGTTTSTDHPIAPSLPVSPSSLIDLALMQNWQQLLVNLKAGHRRQARQRDADGLYPLHWAVSGGPPLGVVRALLRAYAGAAKKVDSEGSTALHFASHYGGSVAMMELLLEANPSAISVQDNYGRSPLYHAVDKSANIDVLRILAAADPDMMTTACRPKNYQALEKEGKRWNYLTPLYLAWVNFLTDQRSVETCAGRVWDKACLLLDLVYHHKYKLADDNVEVPVVVALVALDALLPEELAAVVIRGVATDELLKVDPLTSMNSLALVAAGTRQLSPQRSDELIRLLLEACPNAATEMDREGKTALAHAAENGRVWDSGLARLFDACPAALGWSDKTTGLPPSLLLATSSPPATESERNSVVLADPYSLIGVKAMALKRRGLEQRRKQRSLRSTSSYKKVACKEEQENQHLSSLFQLIKKDPTWIVTV